MATAISARDFVQIRDAARLLGVSEGTLRNWDRAGKLSALRHPVNGYRMYRVADLRAIVQELANGVHEVGSSSAQMALPLLPESDNISASPVRVSADSAAADLGQLHWSLAAALDPKHRPQRWNTPSSTVRRDWRKYPQEAHVLDASETRYRRLIPREIAVLQGFDPAVVDIEGLTDRELIASIGDAVPPPLAKALVTAIEQVKPLSPRTSVEICAGAGGLAEGAASAGLEHILLLDHSEVCGKLLRHRRSWSPERVTVADVRQYDFTALRDRVGLLSGGPPCQPWSGSGLRRGSADPRDLLGNLPRVVADIRPDVFLFENVPGLASNENVDYLEFVVNSLRKPSEDLEYGAVVGRLNAADYGVPQLRRRIFILGLRGESASLAHRCFDIAERLCSHRDPSTSGRGRQPWRTVGDAIGLLQDPGGWRRWL